MSLPVVVDTAWASEARKRFKLAQETVDQMGKALEHTVKTGNEAGFYFCGPVQEALKPADYCEGDKCSVRIQRGGCAPIVGSFHTHPSNGAGMSVKDMLHGLYNHIMFGAVDKGPWCRGVVNDYGIPVVECNHVIDNGELSRLYQEGSKKADLSEPLYEYNRAHVGQFPSCEDPAFAPACKAYEEGVAILQGAYSEGARTNLPVHGLAPQQRLGTLVVDLERWTEKARDSQFFGLCTSKARHVELAEEANMAIIKEQESAKARGFGSKFSPNFEVERERYTRRLEGLKAETCEALTDGQVVQKHDEALARQIKALEDVVNLASQGACADPHSAPETALGRFLDAQTEDREARRLSMEVALRNIGDQFYISEERSAQLDRMIEMDGKAKHALLEYCKQTPDDLWQLQKSVGL